MKSSILLFISIILTLTIWSQNHDQPFKKENFPSDSYKVEYKIFDFENLTIEFIIVKTIDSGNIADDCDIYLNISKGDSIINAKYLGRTWLGGTYGIPHKQPLEKYFMYSKFGEWQGLVTMIDTSGNQITFPGYYWSISDNNKYLLTKAMYPDSELTATKFNIKTGKFITKDWHIGLNGEPWKEDKPSNYRELEINLCD